MNGIRNNGSLVSLVLLLFSFVSLSLPPRIQCADRTYVPSFYTEEIYKELENLAKLLTRDIIASLSFCIKNVDKYWEEAFDFKGKLDFVDSCVRKKGDFRDRICTSAEIRYYFYGFLDRGASSANYVKPNMNCNLTSWVSGCEPSWGRSTGQHVDLEKEFKDVPYRTENCQPCCKGFFCPQGLTCMIPCLLGSYCPIAKLNKQTGLPDTCWRNKSGIANNSDIFCSPGSYCPTTAHKVSCDSGLSADMPKPDKVLIVERVIESLGLQAVRDSLVGTVEKRGISGGQRKRVNVGLEMVMEPSLLILDEPTTGLDSASSTLLLKALRREALEGVNICMVLHQPRMFDGIIFLSKGGFTAYHGPVKKVEEYFAGIGITVPDPVNPPDHFIDVLEDLVKPSSGMTHQQLPVRWMLYNGYRIPPDMVHFADQISASSSFSSNVKDTMKGGADEGGDQSFAGEFWDDMKSSVEIQRDHIEATSLITKDLSNRTTPGVARQ